MIRLQSNCPRPRPSSSLASGYSCRSWLDGKFPDYGRVIPQNHPKKLSLERIALLQALQRAAILTSDKFRGVRWVLGKEV